MTDASKAAPRRPVTPAGQTAETGSLRPRRLLQIIGCAANTPHFTTNTRNIALVPGNTGLQLGNTIQVLLVVAGYGTLFLRLTVVVFARATPPVRPQPS
ncbi:MAG: hypothetical protein IPH37_19840 [Burkholderiales bacterium]|nr:hypothetical protein [Burkholderiales bacterium]